MVQIVSIRTERPTQNINDMFPRAENDNNERRLGYTLFVYEVGCSDAELWLLIAARAPMPSCASLHRTSSSVTPGHCPHFVASAKDIHHFTRAAKFASLIP